MKSKKFFKKVLGAVCALTIATSSMVVAPVSVAAATATTYKESDIKSYPVEKDSYDIHWKLTKKGVLTVTRKDGVSGLVKIRDCGSTADGDHIAWYNYRNLITEVNIDKNIKRIGNYAFYGLKNVTTFFIGRDVTEMGTAPFSRCDGVKKYMVSSESKSYYAPDSGVLYNSDKTLLVAYPANKKPSDDTFTMPASIKEIKGSAFYYNQNLKYFKMAGSNLTRINDRAFMGCKSLKNITIENGCTYIGKRAFYNNTSLTDLTLPPSVTTIGDEILLSGSEYKPVLKIHCAASSPAYKALTGKGYSINDKKYNFKVTFNPGTNATVSKDNMSVVYGSAYGSLPIPVRDGYTFVGWYKSANYTSGDLITSKTSVLTASNHTLYAKFVGSTYTIKLDACNGTCNRTTIDVVYNERFGSLPVATKYGYQFIGWFTTAESGGEQIFEDSIFSNNKITTLYARYKRVNFDITLDADGGSCLTNKIEATVGMPYGTLPIPKKAGYDFIGWFTKDGKQITADMIVENDTYDVLYAKYEKKVVPTIKEYKIKLDAGKGTSEIKHITFTYGEKYGNLPTPSRPGYDFIGWYTEDGIQIYSDDIFEDEAMTTLYAKYQKIAVDSVKGIKISYKSKTKVKLSWNKVKGATGYEVYKKTNSGAYKLLKTVSGTSTTAKLAAKNSYKFRIRAFVTNNDFSKTYGVYGGEVSRTKTAVAKPNLKVKYNKSAKVLTVKWKAAKDVKKYQVYIFKNKKWKKVKLSSTAFSIRTTNGKTYKFKVRGYKTVLGHKYYGKFSRLTKRV